jgi:NTE family protein
LIVLFLSFLLDMLIILHFRYVTAYLGEIDFSPHIIAGTSISALNGAILASNTSFKQSGDRLWQLWKELGEANIINW